MFAQLAEKEPAREKSFSDLITRDDRLSINYTPPASLNKNSIDKKNNRLIKSKKLFIPSKVWTSPSKFLKEFPEIRTSLAIILLDGVVGKTKKWYGDREEIVINGLRTYLTVWEYSKQIKTHRDAVSFVLGPDKPLKLNWRPKSYLTHSYFKRSPFKIQNTTTDDCAVKEQFYCKLSAGDLVLYSHFGRETTFNFSKSEWRTHANNLIKQAKGAALLLPVILGDSRAINDLTQIAGKTGKGANPVWPHYKNALINNIGSLFQNFEARSQSSWQWFDEIYKEISVDQVPKNTICYKIKGKKPPIDKIKKGDKIYTLDWETPVPWSGMFVTDGGKAILNAVAMNFPVKIRTRVENWKNPDKPELKQASKYVLEYKYVFQDFIIEINKNGGILITYARGHKTYKIDFSDVKKSWGAYLTLCFLAIVAIVVLWYAIPAIGGAITGGGTSGAAVGGGAATTTGSTLASTTGTIETAAGYVSAVSGTTSAVAGATGDEETAKTAKQISQISGAVGQTAGALKSGGKPSTKLVKSGVQSKEPSTYQNIMNAAKPLVQYALQKKVNEENQELQKEQIELQKTLMQAKTKAERKRLMSQIAAYQRLQYQNESGLMMQPNPYALPAGYKPATGVYTKKDQKPISVIKGVPNEYLLIGGFGFMALLLLTSLKR